MRGGEYSDVFGRLQKAAAVAQTKGLPDLKDQATRELQKMKFEDLGMQKVGGTLRLPTEAFSQRAARMTRPPRSPRHSGSSLATPLQQVPLTMPGAPRP
ncbi:predicted protein [Streptomyces sp. C]|nr:predicted protein [Streptomyces sp. C]